MKIDLEPKYNVLIKGSKIRKSKYDLIADYKKVISDKRKEEVIKKLMLLKKLEQQQVLDLKKLKI